VYSSSWISIEPQNTYFVFKHRAAQLAYFAKPNRFDPLTELKIKYV